MTNKDPSNRGQADNSSEANAPEAALTKDEKLAKDEKITAEITQISNAELEEKLNEAEAKANENWEKFLHAQADMENMRRRMERDVANAHKYGVEKLIGELLPIIDGLERGLALSQAHDASKNAHEGMAMTQQMLLKALEKFGVKEVNPLGETFNPNWHQALTTKEEPDTKSNTVLEVLQKGYLLQDRLLRPALVVVAK